MTAGGGRAGRSQRADAARRRRLLHRGLPALVVLVLAAVALAIALAGGGSAQAERRTAERYVALWARGDYAGMHALLDAGSRARTTPEELAAAYREAALTATIGTLDVGAAHEREGNTIPVEVTVRTRIFGTLQRTLALPVRGSGEAMRVVWHEQLVFPGLRRGEPLTRTTTLPPRAALLARDGTVLAEGAARTSQAPDVSAEIGGRLGPAPLDQQAALRALGYPSGAVVGVSGLERAFEHELAGRPGGTLMAGARVLAQSPPHPGRAVRTTIDPAVERAAAAALAGRYGGIAAIVPRTGEILALAGVAFSALQPPGSTFKIVTLTGILEGHLAKADTRFPIADSTTLAGVRLENANGEYCGGTLVDAFAHSCNSVFAPLGAQLGARRLAAVAERFGFNEPPAITGAAQSTVPPAELIGDALGIGSSAIGQGQVQATALQMTAVAATIAMRGRRPLPTLRLGERPRLMRVTRPAVARQVARMMRAVVAYGTGTAAAIDGVEVAGKTGTAELRSTVPPKAEGDEPAQEPPPDSGPDTDAWFVGYAPAAHPRIAVGALLVEAGAGGDVAAPAVRQVLIAALQRRAGA